MKINSRFARELKNALVMLYGVSESEFEKVIKSLNFDKVKDNLFSQIYDNALIIKSYSEFESELLCSFRHRNMDLTIEDLRDFLNIVSSVLKINEYHNLSSNKA